MAICACTSLHQVPNWSRLGRLRRSQMPRSGSGAGGNNTFFGVVAAGRLVCDTYLAAKDLIRETTYALTELVASQLKVKRVEVRVIALDALLLLQPI